MRGEVLQVGRSRRAITFETDMALVRLAKPEEVVALRRGAEVDVRLLQPLPPEGSVRWMDLLWGQEVYVATPTGYVSIGVIESVQVNAMRIDSTSLGDVERRYSIGPRRAEIIVRGVI